MFNLWIFLAVMYVVSGLVMSFRPANFLDLINQVKKDPSLGFVMGTLNLLFGAACLAYQPEIVVIETYLVWSLGVIALLKGLALMVCPEKFLLWFAAKFSLTSLRYLGVVLVLVGLALGYWGLVC